NPHAKYREPITVEDVLASRVISSPLHLLDCCMISDGGGALVLTSVARARDLRRPPVTILGAAEAVQHSGIGARDLADVAARQSGPLALARGGLKHHDVDVALVYDSYTITVLVTLEALGFCAPGEGGAFCAGGRIGLGRAAGEPRRRRALLQPSRHARHLPRHRRRAAAPWRRGRAAGR